MLRPQLEPGAVSRIDWPGKMVEDFFSPFQRRMLLSGTPYTLEIRARVSPRRTMWRADEAASDRFIGRLLRGPEIGIIKSCPTLKR